MPRVLEAEDCLNTKKTRYKSYRVSSLCAWFTRETNFPLEIMHLNEGQYFPLAVSKLVSFGQHFLVPGALDRGGKLSFETTGNPKLKARLLLRLVWKMFHRPTRSFQWELSTPIELHATGKSVAALCSSLLASSPCRIMCTPLSAGQATAGKK